MSSFISSFKAWFLAALIFVGIETTYFVVAQPHEMDRTNLLQYSFSSPEAPQRLFTWHKMHDFVSQEWEIVQVGDSSGFHGIDPRIVGQYLPDGYDYINMSCCGNQGYMGYYNVLKYMLDRVHTVKYAVLHITPYTMPKPETWKEEGAALWGDPNVTVFGKAIGNEANPPWAWLRVPTLAARRAVSHNVFFLGETFKKRAAPLLINKNYALFLEMYKDSSGWMPARDPQADISNCECDILAPTEFDIFSLQRRTILEDVLETFAGLARQYKIKLIVVFQPGACIFGTGKGSEVARAAIKRFQAQNPDVAFPFPLIETWDAVRFLVPAHIHKEWVPDTSKRLGLALRRIIEENEATAPSN